MLNFDEFRAVNNREKAKETLLKKTAKVDSKVENKSVTDHNDILQTTKANSEPIKTVASGIMAGIGEFLETHQMQALYILLVILDSFAHLAESYLIEQKQTNFSVLTFNTLALLRAIRSFSTFALLFFSLEVLTVFIVFQSKVFGHFGYSLDLLITGYQVYIELNGHGKYCNLLNICRYWRLFRLFNSMVDLERTAHSVTRAKLLVLEDKLRASEVEIVSLRVEATKEREARSAVEDMLGSYKDEVDTLNEALRIAAMDIAEVAQADEEDDDDYSDYLGEEDSAFLSKEGGRAEDDSSFQDASSSKYSKNHNKGVVMRAVMDDSLQRAGSHSAGANVAAFLIHEDGTFEQK